MLSVPTLWTVFVINFLALGLIWAYVMRSYPSFDAARFWTASSLRRRRRRLAGDVARGDADSLCRCWSPAPR